MSVAVHPAARALQHSLESTLTGAERFKIGLRLGSAMLAGGLLAVGVILADFGSAETAAVGELVKAIAALVVVTPILLTAARGVLTNDSRTLMEQLVAVAALAAMASGQFATAVLVPVIMDLGHFLEQRSILGAQSAIDGLKRLHARQATLVTTDGERLVDPATLQAGDLILVRPGDIVPADGDIHEGSSAVDQASLTGESVPHEVSAGERVYAGSVNLSGMLTVSVRTTGSRTALGKVLDLLRDAEQSKTPVTRMMEQYAGFYVPIALTIAAVVLFVSRDVSRAVTVLVVSCPGAFVLAGPAAMVASLAAASRLGILIKNSKFLESMADVDTVLFDKTGTVTLGQLDVFGMQPVAGRTESELLEAAVRCAHGSRHPVCRAICNAADTSGASADRGGIDIREIPGKGTIAVDDGMTLRLGRRDWILAEGIDVPENPVHDGPIVWVARTVCINGRTVGETLGCVLLADQPRAEAMHAVAELKRMGIARTVLLTGDRREVANAVARSLVIDEVIADALPEHKLDAVHAARESGATVMVVGDGVNDALCLAGGDIGVAMGAMGSDIALKSADVALMTNDLSRLPLAVALSRKTRATINQNILIGAGFSALMLSLASFGVLSPFAGAILHNLGEFYVVFNSARLLHFGLDPL